MADHGDYGNQYDSSSLDTEALENDITEAMRKIGKKEAGDKPAPGVINPLAASAAFDDSSDSSDSDSDSEGSSDTVSDDSDPGFGSAFKSGPDGYFKDNVGEEWDDSDEDKDDKGVPKLDEDNLDVIAKAKKAIYEKAMKIKADRDREDGAGQEKEVDKKAGKKADKKADKKAMKKAAKKAARQAEEENARTARAQRMANGDAHQEAFLVNQFKHQANLDNEKEVSALEDPGLMKHMREARRRAAADEAEKLKLPELSALLAEDKKMRQSMSTIITTLKEEKMRLQCANEEIIAAATSVNKIVGKDQPHGYPPVDDCVLDKPTKKVLIHLEKKIRSPTADLAGVGEALDSFERTLTLMRRAYEQAIDGYQRRCEHYEKTFMREPEPRADDSE